MTEVYRKIGFDAADAIAQLAALGEAVDSTGKRIEAFDKISAFRSGGGMTKGLQESKAALVQFSDGSKVAVKSLDELVEGAQRANQGLKPLNDGIHESEKRAKKGASTMRSFAKSIGSLLAIRAVIGVFNTFTGVLSSTTQEAREFGLAIAEIQTIAGSLNATSAQVNRQVLDLSSNLGTDALDTAKGLYQVLSNQVVEAGESFEFLATAQKLAITTVASTGEAVDALSSVMNAYGNEAGTAAEVSDTLFEAVNVGRFTLNEIANIIGRVTPLTAQMGISWNETAAAIAAMTQSGVRADTAITQLRAVVVKLLKPTEEMQKLYQSWGVKDGPTAIRTFGGLQGVLKKISGETNGSTAEMTKFFNEVRGLAGVLGLNIDNGERFAKVLGQIEDSAGAAARAFQGFAESDAQQLTKEMTRLKNEVISLGQGLQPVASFFTTGFADIAAGLRVITEDVRARTNEAFALEQRISARRAAVQQANSRVSSQFTAKETKEFKIREQAFLESVASQQKRFNEFINASEQATDRLSDRLKDYGKNLKDSFDDALGALEDRVKTFDDRIKKSVSKSQDIQLKIDDENLRQDLKKAFNPFQKQKLLDEDADRKTYEALNKLREAGTQEEIDAANAAAERAIAAQRAVEASADQTGNFRLAKDTQQEILDLLEAQKKTQDDFTKRTQNQRGNEIKLLDQLRAKESQLKSLVDDRKKAIDRVIESRGKERQVALNALTDIDAQIKKLGFSKEGFKLFETFDAGKLVLDFQKELGQLDTARINWDAAVQTLEQRLNRVKVNIQLETPAGDAQAFAEQLGLDFDPNDLTGTAAKVSDESTKILDDQEALLREQTRIRTAQIGQERSLKDAVGSTLDSISDSAKRQADFNTRRRIETQEYRGDLEGALQTIRDTSPELGGVVDKIKEVTDQIRNQDFESARAGVKTLGETVDRLKSRGDLTTEAYNKLRVLLGTTLPENIDSLAEKANNLKALQDIAPKAEVAEAWRGIQNSVGGAEARAKGLLNAQGQIPQSANSAAQSIKVIGDQYQRSANEAINTVNNTNQIGSAAQTQVGGVKDLTAAMTALKLEAAAAAQAVAAAQSGGAVPAAKGRYFAAGGLGALKPLGTDTIPAMIQRGEFVTNAKSSRKFFSELNAMNQDKTPVRRREGGSVTQVGDIHVAVNGGDTSRQTVRAIAVELNRELKRGTIRLGSLRKA